MFLRLIRLLSGFPVLIHGSATRRRFRDSAIRVCHVCSTFPIASGSTAWFLLIRFFSRIVLLLPVSEFTESVHKLLGTCLFNTPQKNINCLVYIAHFHIGFRQSQICLHAFVINCKCILIRSDSLLIVHIFQISVSQGKLSFQAAVRITARISQTDTANTERRCQHRHHQFPGSCRP